MEKEKGNKMPLYKLTIDDYTTDCIEAESFEDAEQIAIDTAIRLKEELGITKSIYLLIELGEEFLDLFV